MVGEQTNGYTDLSHPLILQTAQNSKCTRQFVFTSEYSYMYKEETTLCASKQYLFSTCYLNCELFTKISPLPSCK